MDNNERLRPLSGIYRFDFSSGHFYIGQSANVLKRWRIHRAKFRSSEMRKHHPKLFNIWTKYGDPVCTPLVYCEVGELTRIEQHLISHYWGHSLFANTNPDARTSRGVKRTHVPWQKGKQFTQEHRQNLSLAKQDVSGTKNNNHKLTEKQVQGIRHRYIRNSKEHGSVQLGREYNVSHRTILYIVNGQRYPEK